MAKINMFEKLENSITIDRPFSILWTVKDIGFGELHFTQDDKGKIFCENEMMSRTFIKNVLNKIADECILKDETKE